MKIKMVKDAGKHNKKALFTMRVTLIREINPLRSEGNELQEILLDCNRIAMGEMEME